MSIGRSIGWGVYKDLYLMRRTLLFYAILLVVFAVLSGREPAPLFAVLAASAAMVPSWIAYVEERNRGLTFLRSLPVPAAAVVGAKYVSMLVVAAILCGVAIPLSAWRAGSLSPGAGPGVVVPVAYAVGMITVVMLVPAGVSLWAFFRWGYQAVRYAFLGIWVFFALALWPVAALVKGPGPGEGALQTTGPLQALRPWYEAAAQRAQASPGQCAAIAVLVTLALYGLSAVGAYRALRRREV